MALKLHDNKPVNLPGTVRAIVAPKLSTLQHQMIAKIKNEEQLGKAGKFLHRIHNG